MIKKSWLFLVVGLFFFALNVQAQEAEVDSSKNANDAEKEELNAFGYPYKSFVTTIEAQEKEVTEGQAVNMPDCNDPRILEQLRSALLPYIDNGDTTIINHRKVNLMLKNINKMVEIDHDGIDTSKTNAVADRVIELKINMKKHIKDIKICKSDNQVMKLSEFYIIMYYNNNGNDLIVEVLNFTSKNPMFVFTE